VGVFSSIKTYNKAVSKEKKRNLQKSIFPDAKQNNDGTGSSITRIDSQQTFIAFMRYDSKLINALFIIINTPLLLAGLKWINASYSIIGFTQGTILF